MKQYNLSFSQISIISLLVIALGIFVIYFFDLGFNRNTHNNPPISKATQAIMESRGKILLAQADAVLISANAALRKDSTETIVPSPAETKPQPLWREVSKTSARPTIPLSEQLAEYQAVELDPSPTVLPTKGDLVVLPMPKGQTVTVEIEDTTVNPNGDYTWKGHIQGSGSDYPVVFTYGSNSTFATISTPSGSFSLETLNGLGWLYKNPSLGDLDSHNGKDFLEPKFVK